MFVVDADVDVDEDDEDDVSHVVFGASAASG
jgi:hypothetical protein